MTNLLDKISTPIKNEFESFINLYNETLSSKGGLLDEVCQNILSHKGKMMRPILLLLIAKELGKVNKSSLLSAVTLEILHTASLLHDDVVDDIDTVVFPKTGRCSGGDCYSALLLLLHPVHCCGAVMSFA